MLFYLLIPVNRSRRSQHQALLSRLEVALADALELLDVGEGVLVALERDDTLYCAARLASPYIAMNLPPTRVYCIKQTFSAKDPSEQE